MKKLVAALALLGTLGSTTLAKAQSVENRPFGLGFGGGSTTGLGVAARYSMDKWWLQGTFFPYYIPGDPGPTSLFAGGLSAAYVLNRGSVGSVYLSLGTAGYRSSYNQSTVTCPTDILKPEDCVTTSSNSTESRLTVGPGVGFEFRFGGNFAATIAVPAAVVFLRKPGTSGFAFEGIYPIPDFALLYTF